MSDTELPDCLSAEVKQRIKELAEKSGMLGPCCLLFRAFMDWPTEPPDEPHEGFDEYLRNQAAQMNCTPDELVTQVVNQLEESEVFQDLVAARQGFEKVKAELEASR